MAEPGAIAPTRGSYFTRHWRGELSLLQSFWLNGVAIGFACMVAEEPLKDLGQVFVLLLAAGLLAILVIIVWQLVGIWRAAGSYTGSRFWPISARVFAVIAALFGVLKELYILIIALGGPLQPG